MRYIPPVAAAVKTSPGSKSFPSHLRTYTQASFRTEAAAITLLYWFVAFGQVVLRRIAGHEQLPTFLAKEWSQAA
jgi:hypothetical protein